ncbi:MAG: acyltransferase [Desulfamplus sp.]|nr:acyltransferase [Desulfamplus sp.]
MNQKNIEIQFLRVIAIVMVLIMHAPVGMLHQYAEKFSTIMAFIHPAVGVDIFFVISGYLMGITFLHRTELNRTNFDNTSNLNSTDGNLNSADSNFNSADLNKNVLSEKISLTARFYLRRFWRLFPASFFWITVTLIVGVISGDHEIWLTNDWLYKAWIASVLCFRNFQESIHPTHLGYYWSLSVENQFYLLLPLAWFFVPKKWFWKGVILICIICIFWRPGGNEWWLFRFDGLLMGLLIYKLTRIDAFKDAVRFMSPETRTGRLIMTAFLCLAIPSVPNSIGVYPPLTWSIVALLSSILVSQAVLNEGYIYIPEFLKQPIYWLGEFSYSVYLCHLPVWLIFKDAVKRNPDWIDKPSIVLTIGVVSTISIFICAALTYFFIEQPCQKIGYRKLNQNVKNR